MITIVFCDQTWYGKCWFNHEPLHSRITGGDWGFPWEPVLLSPALCGCTTRVRPEQVVSSPLKRHPRRVSRRLSTTIRST
jgi:hypothetical protein